MIEKDREKVLRQGIEEGFYPRYLYKYWSFESAKRFLETGKIKYSAFHEFNDPFEASFGFGTSNEVIVAAVFANVVEIVVSIAGAL